jgi:hypothetical protein
MTDETALERGRRDYRRQAWSSACAALTAADQRSPIAIDDLELLATAGYLAGEDVASDAAWTRAFQQRQRDGDAGRAARCACWIAFRLLNVGDVARGDGWAARARRALAEGGEPDCVEQGYVRYLGALQAIFGSDPIAAAAGFAAAAAVGVRFGDADLVTLSHTGEGRARIYLGDTADGVALLDEAMVAITAGEVSPVIVGDSYCSVIEACSELFDLGRVHAWTSAERGWDVTGVELVGTAVRRARRRISRAGVPMRIVRGDVTALRTTDVGSGFRLILNTGTLPQPHRRAACRDGPRDHGRRRPRRDAASRRLRTRPPRPLAARCDPRRRRNRVPRLADHRRHRRRLRSRPDSPQAEVRRALVPAPPRLRANGWIQQVNIAVFGLSTMSFAGGLPTT